MRKMFKSKLTQALILKFRFFCIEVIVRVDCSLIEPYGNACAVGDKVHMPCILEYCCCMLPITDMLGPRLRAAAKA